jgi:hypothetical protein
MRSKVNSFDFHGIRTGDGNQFVAIHCHVCRELLRSSDPNIQEFTHCGRVYKRPRHLKGSSLPVVESKNSKRLTRRLKRRVQKEIAQEKTAKAKAALMMGPATRDSLEDSSLFRRYMESMR